MQQKNQIRRLFGTVASILMLAFALHSPVRSQQQNTGTLAGDMPVDPKVTVGKLANGLTYYVRENAKPEKRAELRLVVNAGSILEDDDQRGLAHFAEHMAFNGTRNFAKQELVDYLESIGMRFGPDLNAYTSFDETVYMLKVPTDTAEVLEKAFQILEDWAQHVSFDHEEIDKERGVVVEEWRLGRGANARMLDKQLPVLFKDSHYANRLVIGTKENLETFDYETLKRYYRDWYRPDLMAVIAVGDFDKARIIALIEQHFAGLTMPEKPRERKYFPVPNHEETLFAIATDPEAQRSMVSVYYKHPPEQEGTHEAYRESIIGSLYNGMLNARLSEIGQQPDAPFLFAGSFKGGLIRTKSVYGLSALVKDHNFTGGLDALLTEAKRVDLHGFTQTELTRQKAELLRGMEKAYEEREKSESNRFAAEYVRSFLTGEGIPGIAYEYELNKKYLPEITLEEVNAMGRAWIIDDNRVVLINAPEKEDVEVPTEQELAAVFEHVSQQEVAAYTDDVSDAPLVAVPPKPGRVLIEKRIEPLGVIHWKLNNGIRVFLKPTDFKEDELVFTSYSPGGNSLAADANYVAASTAASVVNEGGVGSFDQVQLQKQLAGKIVNVTPYISSLEEGISGSASPKDMETMFQLIHLYFTSPRRDSTAFVALQNRLKGLFENRSASPEAAFSDTIQVTMAQYHPRAKPLSEAFFEAMDLDTSFAFFQERFADASDFTFFFAGNFDPEAMKPLVQTYLASLPALKRKDQWRDVGIRPPQGVIKKTVHRGSEPKSLTQIIFTGDFDWSRQNRYELQSMVAVLRIMLRERIREDLGGSYGVGVTASPSRLPVPGYRLTINFGSDPQRQPELVKAVFEEVERLKKEGPAAKNLAKVQETQRREHEVQLKQNNAWLTWLEFYDQHNEDPEQILEYEKLVAGLTAKAVQNAAQRYLNTDNYVQVTLLPAQEGQ